MSIEDWLEENGPATALEIAAGTGRAEDFTRAYLREAGDRGWLACENGKWRLP